MPRPIEIDLYSNTVTRPTPEMRRFLSEAEVGDEQRGDDPTVNRLQAMVAELLGKEAAVYLPSGTMCNEIAFGVHCRPGDEILMDRTAHPLNFEAGGPAALSGALIRPLDGRRGIFTAAQVAEAVREPSRYFPRSRVLSVEQTTNLGGGACWPLTAIVDVCAAARERGLATHLDGARLFNAVVASDTAARDFAAPFDSAWIDLSKGLGAPIGAVLAGSREFIDEAWRLKQRWGGAMRQAGIIAAAGVYALEHHVARLADDHANARVLAMGLAGRNEVRLDPGAVETNIVLIELVTPALTAQAFAERLHEEHGIRISVVGPTTARAVTHLDVSRGDVDTAVQAMNAVLAGTSA